MQTARVSRQVLINGVTGEVKHYFKWTVSRLTGHYGEIVINSRLGTIPTHMTLPFDFSTSITVHVVPNPASGLAVLICFEMSKKNNFNYTIFVGKDGVATIRTDELLKWFDETRFLFLMDYVNPRSNFTGRITARVLSNSDLLRASEALERFHGKVQFPTDYEKHLRAAVSRGQNPEEYHVDVIAE